MKTDSEQRQILYEDRQLNGDSDLDSVPNGFRFRNTVLYGKVQNLYRIGFGFVIQLYGKLSNMYRNGFGFVIQLYGKVRNFDRNDK
jgi:hypothetical protein